MRWIAFALLVISAPVAAQEYPRPLTEDDKTEIRTAVKRELLDPDSARFRWNPEMLEPEHYCGFVNAKNRMGGYVGFKAFIVDHNAEGEITRVSILSGVSRRACTRYDYNIDEDLALDD